MQNYNNNTARRGITHVSALGTTQIHLRNPYITAWWSAAFPGFGHLLLSKYIRGFILIIWEVFVNVQANINLGIIYTFQGDFYAATNTLNTEWILLYTPMYFFTIWDCYRTTVEMNKLYVVAEPEEQQISTVSIGSFEINFLSKRNPVMAVVVSIFMPGLGQLYINRIISAFFLLTWGIIFFYYSHLLEALVYFFTGDIHQATSVLSAQWFLFLPSLLGFAMYDAYSSTVENNKLFEKEQRRYFKDHYQNSHFHVLKGKKVER
ncbi:hypothetical protein [Lentibacillus sediminis]|uniref:hypothetical protein n=1 Tax=Lentibacillus sediminis TaxID=1940529 RepID=UPI000C1BAC7E|nr:hypothetical protein [Lentibacillus sediminis]